MRMADAIQQAYNTHWSMINTFTVEFQFPLGITMGAGTGATLGSLIGSASNALSVSTGFSALDNGINNVKNAAIDLGKNFATSYISKKFGKIAGNSPLGSSDINLNIISITTPDITNTPIESYIGNKWFIQNGRDELYRFSITFRDQDQMKIYRDFYKIYRTQGHNYFDDVAFKVIISKDADWYNETDKKFMSLEGVFISGMSNVSFNNTTENQIAEFTVEFKCTSITVYESN